MLDGDISARQEAEFLAVGREGPVQVIVELLR